MIVFFPKCFFFSLENFKARFNKLFFTKVYKFKTDRNKFKDCTLLIDCGKVGIHNFKAEKIISDVKYILGKTELCLRNCLTILYFKLEKKNLKKSIDFQDYLNKL